MHCNDPANRGDNIRLHTPRLVDPQHGPLSQLPQVLVLHDGVSFSFPFLLSIISSALFLFFCFICFDIGRFFLVTLAMVCMAELLAVAMPTEGIAVMFLGIIVPIFTLFAGFLLPRISIPGWWIWAYWISLLQYVLSYHPSSPPLPSRPLLPSPPLLPFPPLPSPPPPPPSFFSFSKYFHY